MHVVFGVLSVEIDLVVRRLVVCDVATSVIMLCGLYAFPRREVFRKVTGIIRHSPVMFHLGLATSPCHSGLAQLHS